MKISELCKLVGATVYAPQDGNAEGEVLGAFASDMMSDVLAFAKNQDVLISGLCNPQTIRTAVMLDMKCILLVRGKVPTPDMITLAVRIISYLCPRNRKCTPYAECFTLTGSAPENTTDELHSRRV